ncbi:MAG: MATE family efflux transporter [Emergencia sp.]
MQNLTEKRESRTTAAVILALAWPTMIEQIMNSAVQYVDTAMVGSLGTSATAAVGATATIIFLPFSVLFALSVAFLSYVARACGARDPQMIHRIVSQAVLVVLISGILLTVIPVCICRYIPVWMQVDDSIRDLTAVYYFILSLPSLARAASIIFGAILRAAGDTKTPMRIGIVMNIVNIVLNFLLIYPVRNVNVLGLSVTVPGAGLGVIGAAAASAVSLLIGGAAMSIALWRHPVVSPKGMKLRLDMHVLKPCLVTALPNVFQRFGVSLGFVFFASMINSIGEAATAAHTIANTVESAFYIPGFGMQSAASTLAGNAYGAGDEKLLKKYASMFIPIEVGLMILTGAALFFSAEPLVGIFSSSDEVIGLGSTVLKMVAVSEPFFGFSIVIEGLMLGVGKTRRPFVYNITGMWFIRIAGTYVCTQILGMGLISAWACMISHNMYLCLLYLITYRREIWNPFRTESGENQMS